MSTDASRQSSFSSLRNAISTAVVLIGGLVLAAMAAGLFEGRVSHAESRMRGPLVTTAGADGWLPIESFLLLENASAADGQRLLARVNANWRSGYAPMLMEAARFSRRYARPVADLLRQRLETADDATRNDVWHAIWKNDYQPHPNYAAFKASLYRGIDSRFESYFADDRRATIRLDEVRWGGVVRDGIPPLKNPQMLAAGEAAYLADTDVVFGIEINGDARAYPKRILAWHEMFKDTIGGVSLCGVYCTLCGMVIPYETSFDGVHHELGTSGFLYRSNKLMYDHATESMWSTTNGVPVIGPLVGQGIKLNTRAVVTTTWGEWRRLHPNTTVLSLNTGHDRDYGEGAAYRDYFATDRLMFTVPDLAPPPTAPAIANKAEVLALRFGNADAKPTAITADFLADRRVFQGEHGGLAYVVVTDASGANRVYASEGRQFSAEATPDGALTDETGARWAVKEDRLVGAGGAELPRLSAHRAFWFGWRAANPETRLIGG